MLNLIAWLSLGLAFLCAMVIAIDEVRHPQKMWIMNVVWPVTALYFSVFALWAYFHAGRRMTQDAMQAMPQQQTEEQPAKAHPSPSWLQAALADTHCGAGCVLADIATEFTIFGIGAKFLGTELYASYLWDFMAAWSLGIVFQYFSIKPMRNLSVGEGIRAAIKADTLSISAFQIGMYAWMAVVFFKLFPRPHLHPNEAAYWLMMQIAMIFGFATSLPVNWFLVKIGWKEAMG